jgi:hypothetical protein
MTRKSAPWTGLGFVLLIGACAASFWFSGKAEKVNLDNQALVANQAVLNSEIVVLKRKLAEAELRNPETNQGPKVAEPGPKKKENAAMQTWQLHLSKFTHKTMIRSTWYRYHDIIAKLDLPPDKQARLVDLLTTKWEAAMDARDAAGTQGITDPKELDAASKQAETEVDTEIVGLIGQPKDDELQHGQDLAGPKMFLERNIGSDFQMGGVPLSPDQENAMAEIYLNLQKQPQPTDQNPAVNMVQMQQTDATTLDKASSVLSPEQMTILKDYMSWNEERVKVVADQPK